MSNPGSTTRKNPFKFLREAVARSRSIDGWNILKRAEIVKDVKTEELTEEDMVIALMGPTGTGKSSFISNAVGQSKGIGHSLESCTSEVNAVRVQVPNEKFGLVLVDTPGFDATHKTDIQILGLVSDWLDRTAKNKVWLSGVLYFHRISDNRMAGTPLRNLKMFEKLCGQNSYKHLIMVTTMWDELADEGIGKRREDELEATFWAPFLKQGSIMKRYQNTKESAWEILEHFLSVPREREGFQLQQELIKMGKMLLGTATKKVVRQRIKKFDEIRKLFVRILQGQMNKSYAGKDVLILLQRQYGELEKQRKVLLGDVEKLKVSLGKELGEALTNLPPCYLDWLVDHLTVVVYGPSRTRLTNIMRSASQQIIPNLVVDMNPEDAQAMADFLSTVLSEKDILSTDEGNRTLVMLSKLTMSAKVYPQRYNLDDVEISRIRHAEGGFASVYKGLYKKERVGVKVIDQRDIEECIKELILWAHLSHRNILPFYGVYRDSGSSSTSICLVSPWMENGTLCEFASRLPQLTRMPLVSDVIDGLLYLHGLNIVHSDLKGTNVLISDQQRALIADFGISHISTATARQKITPTRIAGTMRWAPPEYEEHQGESTRPTKAWDVWSFGCLFYEVLSRRNPFHECRKELQVKIALAQYQIPVRPKPGHNDWDEINDPVWKLMEACWKYAPEERPSFQVIRHHFSKLGSPNHEPKEPISSGSDVGLSPSRVESSIEIDFERVEKILSNLERKVRMGDWREEVGN